MNSQGFRQPLAMNVSINGNNIFQGGRDTVFYSLGTNGAPEMSLYRDKNYRGGKRPEPLAAGVRQHAHPLVMGGAVQGKKLYGSYPSLALKGPDDTGRGALLPTTSTDQVAATLAQWFGVSNGDLDTVFPNLRNFSQRNLGFV